MILSQVYVQPLRNTIVCECPEEYTEAMLANLFYCSSHASRPHHNETRHQSPTASSGKQFSAHLLSSSHWLHPNWDSFCVPLLLWEIITHHLSPFPSFCLSDNVCGFKMPHYPGSPTEPSVWWHLPCLLKEQTGFPLNSPVLRSNQQVCQADSECSPWE